MISDYCDGRNGNYIVPNWQREEEIKFFTGKAHKHFLKKIPEPGKWRCVICGTIKVSS